MKAVAYIRVSSEEQVKNYSLPGQEEECRKAAEDLGYELVKIFREEGKSAKSNDRPQLLEMFEFCRRRKKEVKVVLIRAYDRISRDSFSYQMARHYLSKYNIRVRSITQPTEDDPQGRLMESLYVAMAQYENELKSMRTVAGMKKRLESGLPIHRPPVGYFAKELADGIKTVVKDQERFDLMKRAWGEMAKGIYNLEDIAKMLNKWGFKTTCGKEALPQFVNRIFRHKFYMGIVSCQKWGTEVQGVHEPMVSPRTFFRVQSIMDGNSVTAVPRVKNRSDFPLRGFVKCIVCGRPFTGSWSKGRSKKYAYYRCNDHSPSFPKDKIENEFLELLQSVQPKPRFAKLFAEILKETWEEKHKHLGETRRKVEKEIAELEKMKQQLVEKNLKGVYSDKLFAEQMVGLEEKILVKRSVKNEAEIEQIDIDTLTNFSRFFLGDLARVWQGSSLDQRQRLQGLIFPEGVVYQNPGFGTAALGLPFRILEGEIVSEEHMGWVMGLEPIASCFTGRRSDQLS